jgi:hypothetical protein
MVTPDRWKTFLDLVLAVRQCQSIYRRTLDPMIRRECDGLEQKLDAAAHWLEVDLAVAVAEVDDLAATEHLATSLIQSTTKAAAEVDVVAAIAVSEGGAL